MLKACIMLGVAVNALPADIELAPNERGTTFATIGADPSTGLGSTLEASSVCPSTGTACAGVCIVNDCAGLTLHTVNQGSSSHVIQPGCFTSLGAGFRVIVGDKDADASATGYTLFEGTWKAGDELMYWDLSAISGFNKPVKIVADNGIDAEISSAETCGGANSGVFPCNYGQDCGTKGDHPYNPITCPGCNEHCCDHIPSEGVTPLLTPYWPSQLIQALAEGPLFTCDPQAFNPVRYAPVVTFCPA